MVTWSTSSTNSNYQKKKNSFVECLRKQLSWKIHESKPTDFVTFSRISRTTEWSCVRCRSSQAALGRRWNIEKLILDRYIFLPINSFFFMHLQALNRSHLGIDWCISLADIPSPYYHPVLICKFYICIEAPKFKSFKSLSRFLNLSCLRRIYWALNRFFQF